MNKNFCIIGKNGQGKTTFCNALKTYLNNRGISTNFNKVDSLGGIPASANELTFDGMTIVDPENNSDCIKAIVGAKMNTVIVVATVEDAMVQEVRNWLEACKGVGVDNYIVYLNDVADEFGDYADEIMVELGIGDLKDTFDDLQVEESKLIIVSGSALDACKNSEKALAGIDEIYNKMLEISNAPENNQEIAKNEAKAVFYLKTRKEGGQNTSLFSGRIIEIVMNGKNVKAVMNLKAGEEMIVSGSYCYCTLAFTDGISIKTGEVFDVVDDGIVIGKIKIGL